jgi:hypothetical protein
VADETGTGQGQTPQPQQPAQPAQPAQTYQPSQPPQQYQQPAAQPEKESDHLGRRVLLWTGRIVVALVYIYCVAAIIFISFGFFLLLFGASPDASFSGWIYGVAADFMEPFRGMFSETTFNEAGGTFSVSALFAIAAYAVVAWLVHMAYDWIRHRLWMVEHGKI